MHPRSYRVFLPAALLVLGVRVPAQAERGQAERGQAERSQSEREPAPWSQFRGPGGAGIAAGDHAYPTEFGADKHMLWKCPVGSGHSSPCVWGNRIFLTSCTGNDLETLCVDRTKGKVIWRKAVRADKVERVHRVNSLASSTPTTDGERVYSYFGSYGLVCYDVDGKPRWERKLTRPNNTFGTAASPIVAGNLLILNRDTNKQSSLMALFRKTGKIVWEKDRSGFKSGWSTPVVWRRHGVDQVLIYGAYRLTAYRLGDGEELWSVPGLTDEPCITPVVGDGLVFLTSYNMRTNPEVIGLPGFEELLKQYDEDKNGRLSRAEVRSNKSILSRIDADGEGDHPLRGFFRFLDRDRDGELTKAEWQKMFRWLGSFKHANALMAVRPGVRSEGKAKGKTKAKPTEIVWQHPQGVPECPSPLYHERRIYMVKNGGIVSCLDARNGELKYQKRLGSGGPCYASPVLGDGKIYAASARGVVTVFKAGDKLQVLARNDLGERIMATPALVEGRVYVRTAKHLWAFGGGG